MRLGMPHAHALNQLVARAFTHRADLWTSMLMLVCAMSLIYDRLPPPDPEDA